VKTPEADGKTRFWDGFLQGFHGGLNDGNHLCIGSCGCGLCTVFSILLHQKQVRWRSRRKTNVSTLQLSSNSGTARTHFHMLKAN
jgi:hypothetical protein